MGHRANYVLLDEAGWTLYYSHWAGQRVELDLASGPAAAIRFVRAQMRVSGWIGRAWVEGGALIDTTRRQLVFFGSGDINDPDYRRACLDHLALVWSGWSVRWAYNALRDFSAMVGVADAALDLPESGVEPLGPPLLVEAGSTEPWALLTVREPDGRVRATCLDVYAGHHWAIWTGPDVLSLLPATAPAPGPLGTAPDWGLHVDVGRRRVIWWTAGWDRLLHRVASRWPGWHLEFCADRYEDHLAACDGLVTAPPINMERGRRLLAASLTDLSETS